MTNEIEARFQNGKVLRFMPPMEEVIRAEKGCLSARESIESKRIKFEALPLATEEQVAQDRVRRCEAEVARLKSFGGKTERKKAAQYLRVAKSTLAALAA